MSYMIYQDVFLSIYFQHFLVIYLNNVFYFILKIFVSCFNDSFDFY